LPTNLGPAEILVILVVALIVLGPKRLPEAGRQVGKALAEVRRWSRGIQGEIRDAFDTAEEPPMVSTDQATAEASKTEAVKTEAEAEAVKTEAAQPELPAVEVAKPELPAPEATEPDPPVPSNGSDPPDDPSRQ
jgi:sec-independent protein translocase protein TatA